MNVSATIPATVQIRRSRLLGLVAGVAAVAAATTWAVLTFGVDSGSSSQSLVGAQPQTTYSLPIPSTIVTRSTGDPGYSLPIPSMAVTGPNVGSTLTPKQRRYVDGITSLTPVERAAAFSGSALGSLAIDPQSRRYVERITSLTPRERAAAFGQ